jgi:hypothetical protein
MEHRLFSFISLNWKGKPLVSYETVVNLIGGTKTKTGLTVQAILDANYYETGMEVTPSEMEQIKLGRHKRFPDWNYTISPRSRSNLFQIVQFIFRQYLTLTKISQKYSNPRKQSCQPRAPVALSRRVQSAPSNSPWTECDQVIRPKANNPQPHLPVTLTVRRA